MIDEARLSEIISTNVTIRLIEPHIYSVSSSDENINSYDKMGSIYDSVACNRFYNRLVWGYWTSNYHSLCENALNSSKSGWVLDAGCGSLAFTAKTYVNYSQRPIILLDQSIVMLKMAKTRLIRLNGEVPANMLFMHGDALKLPFKPKSFNTIISMNLLHVFEDVTKVIAGVKNVLQDKGTMAFSTLVLNDRFADKYLHMLAKTGEVVPRNVTQLLEAFNGLDVPIKYSIRGNLCFITADAVHMNSVGF